MWLFYKEYSLPPNLKLHAPRIAAKESTRKFCFINSSGVFTSTEGGKLKSKLLSVSWELFMNQEN